MDSLDLDVVLNWQIKIAWAGEGNCQPKRLGWWRTDLIDREGGGDLFLRLLPKTKTYAGWEAVREVAIAVDKNRRQRMADPDTIRTIFYLGFDIDERLSDRLVERKRLNQERNLPVIWANFDREILEAQIRDCCGGSRYTTAVGGREVSIREGNTSATMQSNFLSLVAALTPWDREYPMPFFRV